MPDKYSPCKRGCCWTPFSCGRQRKCACHIAADKAQQARDAWQDYIDEFLKMPPAPPRKQRPTHCEECSRPLRSKNDPPSPGTVIHQGLGRCSACYTRSRRTSGLR